MNPSAPRPDRPAPPPSRLRRWAVRLAVAYLAAVLAGWAVFWVAADAAAVPTLFLFGPRWLIALPLAVVLPLAFWARSYLAVGVALLAAAVVAGPLMGGTVSPGAALRGDRPAPARLRVVSWNTDGVAPGPALCRFLLETDPDILVCQEARLEADMLPPGFAVAGDTNQVASRLPVRHVAGFNFYDRGVGGRVDRFAVQTPDGEVPLVNVHLPTVRDGVEMFIRSRGRNLTEIRGAIDIRAKASRDTRAWVGGPAPGLIVAGDFNMPVESRIYREHWGDFRNAFSAAGTGWGATKHTSWFGTRIDHVLYTAPWVCRRVWVGPGMGSDHRPVVADLAWEGN